LSGKDDATGVVPLMWKRHRKTVSARDHGGQRLTRRARSACRGQGRRWPVALGPRPS